LLWQLTTVDNFDVSCAHKMSIHANWRGDAGRYTDVVLATASVSAVSKDPV